MGTGSVQASEQRHGTLGSWQHRSRAGPVAPAAGEVPRDHAQLGFPGAETLFSKGPQQDGGPAPSREGPSPDGAFRVSRPWQKGHGGTRQGRIPPLPRHTHSDILFVLSTVSTGDFRTLTRVCPWVDVHPGRCAPMGVCCCVSVFVGTRMSLEEFRRQF